MVARLRSVAKALLGRTRVEDDMDEELRCHVAQHADDLVERGMSRAEAEREARKAFGHMLLVKDACREARALDIVDALRRDVRYALRLLRRSPGFAATVVATVALCIGANSAIFSVVDAVLFRPLPYPAADRLAQVVTYVSDGKNGAGEHLMTAQNGATWELLRDRATSLEWAVFSPISAQINLSVRRSVLYAAQQRVSAGFVARDGRGECRRDMAHHAHEAGGHAAAGLTPLTIS